jgi:hypothetical protein
MEETKIDYEALFHLADKTIKKILEIFEGNPSMSPKDLYELSRIMNTYNDESTKIMHKE